MKTLSRRLQKPSGIACAVAELATFIANGLDDPDLDPKQHAMYEARIRRAWQALHGVQSKNERRQLIREAVTIHGGSDLFDGAEGADARQARVARRAEQAREWIHQVDPELAGMLDDAKLRVAIEASQPKAGGRGKKASVRLGDALGALLSDTNLGASNRSFRGSKRVP